MQLLSDFNITAASTRVKMADSDQLAEKVKEIVQESITGVKNHFQDALNNKRKKEDDVSEVISKKLKEAEVPDFKRLYNKEQFKHNKKVEESIKEAVELINNGSKEKALDKLECLIKQTQAVNLEQANGPLMF